MSFDNSMSMPADEALLGAYLEWRRLAELEGEGIEARDWNQVTDAQSHLAALQPRITRLTALAREEWKQSGVDSAAKEDSFRELISGLIEIGKRNSEALADAKAAVRRKLDQLDIARQNLKRVHRSYSSLQSPVWFSFS
jgi:hypothetical protein